MGLFLFFRKAAREKPVCVCSCTHTCISTHACSCLQSVIVETLKYTLRNGCIPEGQRKKGKRDEVRSWRMNLFENQEEFVWVRSDYKKTKMENGIQMFPFYLFLS